MSSGVKIVTCYTTCSIAENPQNNTAHVQCIFNYISIMFVIILHSNVNFLMEKIFEQDNNTISVGEEKGNL